LFCLAACEPKVLPEEKLADVIAEIYLTEVTLQKENIPSDSPKAMALYEQALKKHGVTMTEYQKSILFYTDKKPDELNAVFEKAVKRLESIRTGIEQDSIRSLYVAPKPAETTDTLAQE
jgi:hypothetical protein